MLKQQDVKPGVVLHFAAPDMSPDFRGPVRRVDNGYVWLGEERWPLDVVARESTPIPQPTPQHRWDGALDRWYLPSETLAADSGAVLSHTRHA